MGETLKEFARISRPGALLSKSGRDHGITDIVHIDKAVHVRVLIERLPADGEFPQGSGTKT